MNEAVRHQTVPGKSASCGGGPPKEDGTMTQMQRYRTDSGEVHTKDELRQRLTAELDAMDRETRAASSDGATDDLIADSILVGTYRRVGDGDGPHAE
jgi:hypothetical protein